MVSGSSSGLKFQLFEPKTNLRSLAFVLEYITNKKSKFANDKTSFVCVTIILWEVHVCIVNKCLFLREINYYCTWYLVVCMSKRLILERSLSNHKTTLTLM